MNKKLLFFKKTAALLLCAVLLLPCSACFNSPEAKNPGNDTGQITDSPHSETRNEAFNDYVNRLFTETVTTDTITLHSYMEHPSDFGVDNYEVTLGRYDLAGLDNTSDITGKLTALKSFDRTTLSPKQQITYDELLIYLQNELEYSDLFLFQTSLCTTTGFHVQFPLILAEYTFEEEKDVKEYLALLEDSDGYFQSLADYEALRSRNGYFMEDALATQIVGECENFIESAGSPDSYLITTFDEKLDALTGISDADKSAYKTANQAAVTGHLIKGYRILTDGLKKLTGTNRYQGGLCNYPDGEKYFRYLLNHSLGWSKSVDEYNTLLDSYIRSNLLTMQTLMAKDSSLSSQFNNFSFSITEPAAVLTDLKTKIAADFPQGPDVSYDIKYITEALQDSVSPAMYFLPQLDNLNINSIYINPKGTRSSQLYPTLAHEGYPGHLYQTTYFADSDPDLIRYLIAPDGYVEGWATYCELFSYSYADTGNPLLNMLAQANYATILCLYAKCDLGINALGWTENDVASYIADFGFTDKNVAHEMYLSMVSNPGNYCKYVLGWIGFSELKKEARAQTGSAFSNPDFHKYILDMGSVPFDMLFDRLEDWCSVQSAQ